MVAEISLVLAIVMVSMFVITLRADCIEDCTFNGAPCHSISQSVYAIHDPIVITSDSDFVDQGWIGSGTEANPYLLKDLNITSTVTCVNITDTQVHFIIRNCVINASWAHPGTGVYLENVTHGVIENCTVKAAYVGVVLLKTLGCVISDCLVIGLDASIVIEESSDAMVSRNVVREYGGDGIHVSESNRTCIFFNSVEGGEDCQEGIVVGGPSWNCSIVNNTVYDHYADGIDLVESVRCHVYNNTVFNSGTALLLEGSRLGEIVNNTLTHNTCGIAIFSESTLNTIYRNRFAENDITNAIDDGTSNTWDDGETCGNWWDDYIGYGLYSISGSAGSVDRFPEPNNPQATMLHYMTLLVIILTMIGLTAGIALGSHRLWKRTVRRSHQRPSIE